MGRGAVCGLQKELVRRLPGVRGEGMSSVRGRKGLPGSEVGRWLGGSHPHRRGGTG